MNSFIYNPWHGCHKYSEGCVNCYVYRRDESIGKDASIVTRTSSFNALKSRNRKGEYRLPSGTHVFCCMTSDFFIEEADEWGEEVWKMIRERSDLTFTIITKRITRFMDCVPDDWNDGYDNVCICCTMENQRQADLRLPLLLSLPIKHKEIICEPLLGPIDFKGRLDDSIEEITCGGESGNRARLCDYDWILDIRRQCIESNISFYFKQTGANFREGNTVYKIERYNQMKQARKANINYVRQFKTKS